MRSFWVKRLVRNMKIIRKSLPFKVIQGYWKFGTDTDRSANFHSNWTYLVTVSDFYPRDAQHGAVFAVVRYCPSVYRPSVCLSHAGTAKPILKHFDRLVAHHSSFFLSLCADTKFQGEPRQ